jgi:hypothetical protein
LNSRLSLAEDRNPIALSRLAALLEGKTTYLLNLRYSLTNVFRREITNRLKSVWIIVSTFLLVMTLSVSNVLALPEPGVRMPITLSPTDTSGDPNAKDPNQPNAPETAESDDSNKGGAGEPGDSETEGEQGSGGGGGEPGDSETPGEQGAGGGGGESETDSGQGIGTGASDLEELDLTPTGFPDFPENDAQVISIDMPELSPPGIEGDTQESALSESEQAVPPRTNSESRDAKLSEDLQTPIQRLPNWIKFLFGRKSNKSGAEGNG